MNFKNYKTTPLILTLIISFAAATYLFSLIPQNSIKNATIKTFIDATGPMILITILLFLYDRHLWSWRFLNQLNNSPDLRGQYTGHITYTYEGKEQQKNCTLILYQTCSTIDIICKFSKENEHDTQSNSNYVHLNTSDTAKHSISFSYRNQGAKMGSHSLQAHDGFNHLDVDIQPNCITLDGYYFTDRPSTGKMRVTKTKTLQQETPNEHQSPLQPIQ